MKTGKKKVTDYKSIEYQIELWEPTCGHRDRPENLWKKMMSVPYYPDGMPRLELLDA